MSQFGALTYASLWCLGPAVLWLGHSETLPGDGMFASKNICRTASLERRPSGEEVHSLSFSLRTLAVSETELLLWNTSSQVKLWKSGPGLAVRGFSCALLDPFAPEVFSLLTAYVACADADI